MRGFWAAFASLIVKKRNVGPAIIPNSTLQHGVHDPAADMQDDSSNLKRTDHFL